MKNRKFIATLLTALMVFITSATAFAEDITVPETEPSTITGVTDANTADVATQTDAEGQSTDTDTEESTNAEDNEGVTIIREDVTLDNTELSEAENIIDTSDISITQGEPEKVINVNYADTYTDIPMTGSSKLIAFGALAAVSSTLIGLIITKKKKV